MNNYDYYFFSLVKIAKVFLDNCLPSQSKAVFPTKTSKPLCSNFAIISKPSFFP